MSLLLAIAPITPPGPVRVIGIVSDSRLIRGAVSDARTIRGTVGSK